MEDKEIIEKLVDWAIDESERNEDLGYYPHPCPNDIFSGLPDECLIGKNMFPCDDSHRKQCFMEATNKLREEG